MFLVALAKKTHRSVPIKLYSIFINNTKNYINQRNSLLKYIFKGYFSITRLLETSNSRKVSVTHCRSNR
jgi:hypothetical protein